MTDVHYSEASSSAPAAPADTELREAAERVATRRRQQSAERGEPSSDEIKTPDTHLYLDDEPRSSTDSEGNRVDEGYTAKDMAKALSKSRQESRAIEQKERELWQQYQQQLVDDGNNDTTAEAPAQGQARIIGVSESQPSYSPPPTQTHSAQAVESQARQQALQQVSSIAGALQQTIPQAFPEIRFGSAYEADDVLALRQTNPEKFQQLAECINYVGAVVNHHQQLTAAESQYQAGQQQAAWITEQGRILSRDIPELKRDARGGYANPEKAAALIYKVQAHLRELGYSDNEVKDAILTGVLDARAMKQVIDAVRLKEMRNAAKSLREHRAPVPPVHRPGAAQPRASASDTRLDELKRKAKNSHDARDAARYIAARRRSAAAR